MCENIVIVGGDKRNIYLFDLLHRENNNVSYINDCTELDLIKNASTIIGPIPFSKDDEYVFSQDEKTQITIKELFYYCKGKKLIAGAISKNISELAYMNNIEIIDLMKSESLAILNTIATAEGTVQIAMQKTERTIQGSNVLVLGFGRVGKVVAQKFAGLSANVTCAARKPEAFAWIETSGYKKININKMDNELNKFDIVINTPPTLILNRQRLTRLKRDCLVIDLASKPGGVDRLAVKELDINFEWALALPGRVAPLTSAEYIKRCL